MALDSTEVDISIIIPVYNVENFLTRCLDSVFNQIFHGVYEVIAVEDCSTDSSLRILKEYKLERPELIIVEHEKNKRLAGARSTGMKYAKGKYLMHVDSDDWLLQGALEKLFKKCIETDADVVAYNYLIENENGEQVFPNMISKEIITSDKLKVQHYFFGGCWSKIVKRDLTQNMIYSSANAPKSTEDLIYCTEILLKANVVCLFPENLYTYFKNNNSITTSTKPYSYIDNQIIILNNLKKIILNYNPKSEFINNLLNYFEKWIYLALCKVHFWSKSDLEIVHEIFKQFFDMDVLSADRTKQLKASFNNKYICLYQVFKRFGFRYPLGILYRSLKK